jgi:hypothetical protein
MCAINAATTVITSGPETVDIAVSKSSCDVSAGSCITLLD